MADFEGVDAAFESVACDGGADCGSGEEGEEGCADDEPGGFPEVRVDADFHACGFGAPDAIAVDGDDFEFVAAWGDGFVGGDALGAEFAPVAVEA